MPTAYDHFTMMFHELARFIQYFPVKDRESFQTADWRGGIDGLKLTPLGAMISDLVCFRGIVWPRE
jgi:hypothetical protein